MKVENKYMTVEEVAQYLRLSKARIHTMALNKQIPCSQAMPGGKYYFIKDEIDEWLNRNR